jgi:hypothetical protein
LKLREEAKQWLPVCAHCTRNARTTETPNVRVRVERALPVRLDERTHLVLLRCHGVHSSMKVEDLIGEEDLENLLAFEAKKGKR